MTPKGIHLKLSTDCHQFLFSLIVFMFYFLNLIELGSSCDNIYRRMTYLIITAYVF